MPFTKTIFNGKEFKTIRFGTGDIEIMNLVQPDNMIMLRQYHKEMPIENWMGYEQDELKTSDDIKNENECLILEFNHPQSIKALIASLEELHEKLITK